MLSLLSEQIITGHVDVRHEAPAASGRRVNASMNPLLTGEVRPWAPLTVRNPVNNKIGNGVAVLSWSPPV